MFGSEQTTWRVEATTSGRSIVLQGEIPMSDVYVYNFMRCRGQTGEHVLSERRATLDAIHGRGKAVMESQIVVDHSEVDADGFLIGGGATSSNPMGERWAEIRSLERRAASRDTEALQMNERSEGRHIYMLSLESRELRKQAGNLRKQRAASARDPAAWSNAQFFVQLPGTDQQLEGLVG
jgi:hypothetical protein